ncbi:5-formyltetrahydrofolate cyclo-ligase isoform X1 [Pieris napi]|uniref:5-formyltetrahydrofolate cyclo-ligase isoform X1 n=2 Tax=Pieris napi TaxID=78633 RepID=UPI001FB9D4E9|nr:5-formyltetrahydrofolate cyclo-ligase isoform X1 [Pieris napi]
MTIKLYRVLSQFRSTNVNDIPRRTVGKMSARTPDPAKVELRKQIADAIAKMTTEEKERQSKIVFNKIINHPYYKTANRVAIFMSTDQEINTAPIISHIKSRGGSAFVPQYAGGIMRMLKLETGDEDAMPLTRHGIAQHSKDQKREDALDEGLDLIIAPGVAFSLEGGRVGHGGGYYDRYIANLRSNPKTAPKVVAVAFNCQVLDKVPMNDLDQKIDEVVYAGSD